MKTNSLRITSIGMLATLVRVIFVSILAAASLFGQPASLASYTPASTPAKTTHGKAIAGLQVGAFPLENTAKVRVSFENATSRQLLMEIQNESGKTLYSKQYPDAAAFNGIIDLSLLADGAYTLQISTLTKVGLVKQAYRQSFRIHSNVNHNITPGNQDSDQKKVSPSFYQVQR